MIAIPVNGDYPGASLSDCFGKCDYFFLLDRGKKKFKFVPNPAKDEKEKSGKKAALNLIKNGVKTVMLYNIGLHAKNIFDRSKIQIVLLPGKVKTLNDVGEIMKIEISRR